MSNSPFRRRTREEIQAPLPAALQAACDRQKLHVLLTPFGGPQAVLMDPFGGNDHFTLFVEETAPPELIVWTTKQALADLGTPGFEGIPLEPFGRLPEKA